MPIERSSPGKVTFSWKSAASIYAFCFYCFATVIVLVVGYERVKILSNTQKFDESIYGVLFIIFLVPHFWIPFVGWGVANDVAAYKTNWGTFQVRYFRVTGENLEFPRLKVLIVIISIGCLLCAVLFIVSLSILLEGFPMWHTSAYCENILFLNNKSDIVYSFRPHNDDAEYELRFVVHQQSGHQSRFRKFVAMLPKGWIKFIPSCLTSIVNLNINNR